MATPPRKSKDPTELALSAIEDALNVREPAVREPAVEARRDSVTDRAPPEAGLGRRRPSRLPPAAQAPAPDDGRIERAAAAERSELRTAANDDRESIGRLLQALQRRPSRTPLLVAWLFAAAWAVLAAGLVFGTYASELGDAVSHGIGAAPVIVGLIAGFAAPIVFFFMLAGMLSRSQELRLVGQSMAEIALRLAEPDTVARDSVVSVGHAVRREVAAMGDGIERALARASELESLVNNEVAALERAYQDNEARMRGLIDGIASQRETLVGHAEQVRAAISNVHVDLSHEIGAVSDMVAEQVNEAANRITEGLTEKGEHIARALGNTGDNMIAALGVRGGDLLERLERASDVTAQALEAATERMTSNLSFKTAHLNDEFGEIADNIQHMMASRLDRVADEFSEKAISIVDSMDMRSRAITDTMVETSGNLAETITARVDEVNNTLKATGDSLVLDMSLRGGDVVAKLGQTGASITEAINSSGTRVSETFLQNAEALATAIATRGDAVRDVLAERLQSFEEMFTHGGTELAERIGRDSSTLGELITRHLTEFDHTVKTYGGGLVERISERTEQMNEALRNYVDGFDSRVSAKAGDVASALDQRLARFQEALDGRTQGLNDALSARIMDIAKTVADGGKEVVSALDTRLNAVSDTLAGRAEKIAETIENKVAEIDETLGTRALEVANNFDHRISRFEDLLLGRAENVTKDIETRGKATAELLINSIADFETSSAAAIRAITSGAADAERSIGTLSSGVTNVLKQNASEVERTLLNVSSQVARTFVGKADEIVNAIGKRSNELTTLLDDKSSTLVTAIGTRTNDLANELARATEQAAQVIDTKGMSFARSLKENSTDVARAINEAAERATSGVNKAMKDLHDASQDAIEQSKKTSSTAVAEMLETHGMLRSDTTALFERLREANGLLQEVLSGAQTNLNSIEHVLSTRVTEFVSTMNSLLEKTGSTTSKMDQHIGSFYGVTAKTLGNLSDLAIQFDEHGRSLQNSVKELDDSNRRSDEAITGRRESLESLITSIDNRTAELDLRLKRFSGLLDESLASAEGRARDIARTIAESSSTGTRAIVDQYQEVRDTAEQERERTIESMRTIYQHATGDVQAMFEGATERFTEIVQGMKNMSSEMQRELESTRQELRRGILELPQETAESAAQMRRVIVDQIEALAELNRIVARHGREFEVVETARRAPDLMVAGAGGRMEAPRGRAEYAPSPSVAPQNGARPQNYAPAASPQQQQPARPAAANNNWLSDLLNRASTDTDQQPQRGGGPRGERPEERPTRHSIESLDSLSVDIARMIDHDAAAELWERYNRGERNVFTRRLYTMQGQKAFDEIRRRYRADREFKQTVDRYIAEFERLLEDVSRDDRGQVVARTYLTSETGKVYTMLAHAAGRIE